MWEEEEEHGQRFCSGKRLADSRGGEKTCLAARRTEDRVVQNEIVEVDIREVIKDLQFLLRTFGLYWKFAGEF